MRLLIADDDAATRRILRSYVSRWGHEIVECTNGEDALRAMLEPDRPAVAILDWMMPGLHGPEVCRRLRARDRHSYVILLTVRTSTHDVIEAIEAGADEHLSKTMAPAELRARLEAALRVATLRDQIAQQMRLTRLQLDITRVLAEAPTAADAWPLLLRLLCGVLGFDGAIVSESSAAANAEPRIRWYVRPLPDPSEQVTRLVPVVVGTNTLATIKLIAGAAPTVPPEASELLPILASQIGQFLIRKQSEAALQQAVSNLRALVASSPLPIATFDYNGVAQTWNEAAERTFGWTAAEVIGRDNPIVPTDRQHESARFRASVLRGEQITGIQVQRQTKDGRMLDVSLSTAPLRGPDGANTGVMAIFQDISEEKAVERELLDAHAETERLFSVMASVLIGLTAERRVTRWNSAAASTFQCKASDAIGRALHECPIAWDAALLEQHVAECQRLRTRVDVNDFRYTLDGVERFLNIVLTPVTAGREAGGVVLLASDVTDYRLLQSQLGQAQKLESIGALAAGIAHEINTPMQYIGDNIRFVRDNWPVLREALTQRLAAPDPLADVPYLLDELPNALEQTLDGVARVSVIVAAMKEFAHPGTGERTPIDINHAIATAINVARHEWRYVCEIETDLAADLPLVPCRPGEFNQVVLNLVVNAAQAIAAAGPREGTDDRIVIRTRQVDEMIEIVVADTGTGIPEAIRARVFDPFFTTKEVGRGTGQGLAIAHDIVVSKHQGRIWFETQPGLGTTFHVRLPLHPMESAHGYSEADTVRR